MPRALPQKGARVGTPRGSCPSPLAPADFLAPQPAPTSRLLRGTLPPPFPCLPQTQAAHQCGCPPSRSAWIPNGASLPVPQKEAPVDKDHHCRGFRRPLLALDALHGPPLTESRWTKSAPLRSRRWARPALGWAFRPFRRSGWDSFSPPWFPTPSFSNPNVRTPPTAAREVHPSQGLAPPQGFSPPPLALPASLGPLPAKPCLRRMAPATRSLRWAHAPPAAWVAPPCRRSAWAPFWLQSSQILSSWTPNEGTQCVAPRDLLPARARPSRAPAVPLEGSRPPPLAQQDALLVLPRTERPRSQTEA
eukprot:RCo012492